MDRNPSPIRFGTQVARLWFPNGPGDSLRAAPRLLAIAQDKDPSLMAEAFRQGVEAGRKAYLAGRIERKSYAQASSPEEGVVRAP